MTDTPKDNVPAVPSRRSEAYAAAQQAFADYFARNYPGPDTIIFDPAWHAPKLFAAACRAITETNDAEAAAIGRQRMIEECDE